MIGMSSFTAYTRWHCLHFKLSGLWRYSSACLQAGQTRISSRSLAIMTCALYDKGSGPGVTGITYHSTTEDTEDTEDTEQQNGEKSLSTDSSIWAINLRLCFLCILRVLCGECSSC